MKLKKIIIIGAILGLLGGAYGLYLYNKPTVSISKKKTEITITAQKLLSDFKKDEGEANTKYLNKTVEVSGRIKEIKQVDQTQNIILETNDMMSSVICEMDHDNTSISIGNNITIKGQCVGYLMDVVLTKSIIL